MKKINMTDEPKKTEEPVTSKTPETERDEYLAGWKRALADYDNLKKDLSRERGVMRQAVMTELLIMLLPLVNNFDEAAKHRPHTEDMVAEKWIDGAMQIKTQLESALKELGAEPFDGAGEKFNPELHESAGSRREEAREDGIVLEVVRRGWKVNDRVVCPAKVIINSL